jgi:exodeoxyribonuclease VII small subunit
MKPKKPAKDTLESSLRRLEEIVETMEKGDVTLDEALNLYEEGIIISKECADKLKTAELKIKKISRDIDSQLKINDEE